MILGSGKSTTMEGSRNDPGVIPNVINFLINENQKSAFEIKCSFVEIYNEKLIDLSLNDNETAKDSVCIRPTKTILGLTENRMTNLKESGIQSVDQFNKIFSSVIKRRKVAATQRNQGSSRSHAVVQINLKGQQNDRAFESNLLILDLAGAENAGDHMNDGETSKRSTEMANINKSLSTFRTAIESSKKAEVVDYRSS